MFATDYHLEVSSILSILADAEEFMLSQDIKLELVTEAPLKLLETISERSNALPTLYFASVEMLQERIKNGCFLLKKENEVIGHIFAHKHMVQQHAVYERASLWVKKEFRNYNLGLLLMNKLTDLLEKEFVISIASEPIVHHNNQLLGMQHVRLSQMSEVLVQALEKIGKLRDELKYRYYVNALFASQISSFK